MLDDPCERPLDVAPHEDRGELLQATMTPEHRAERPRKTIAGRALKPTRTGESA